MSEHGPVHLPSMCKRHQCEVVDRLGIPETGPWQVTIMAVNLACFRAISVDPSFRRRTDEDPAMWSIVLAEVGCMACYAARAFDLALQILQADGDWKPLFGAAFGKTRHPSWPDVWTLAPREPERPT